MPEAKELSFDERIAFCEEKIGVKYNRESVLRDYGLPKGCPASNTSASADNIRRYVDGISDLNSRFRDSEYAKRTKYGCLVAPALFLQTVAGPLMCFVTIPGSRAFYSGSDWEFFRPIVENDKLDFNGVGTAAVDLRESKFSGRMIVTTSICEYRNHREVVALAKGFNHHPSDDEVAVSMGKYKDIQVYRYTEEELRRIEEDYAKEEMRGSQLRYWEVVVEGEPIPNIVNGPRTIMDSITFMAGCPSAMYTSGPRLYRIMATKEYPRNQMPYDPVTNTLAHIDLPHFDNEFAKRVGVPAAYDLGRERECVVATLFDNWMGDDGFLWKYSIQFRRFVIYGDTNWYKGKVITKYIDDGKCCVDIEFWGDNQRGERTTSGKATVILPSKQYGPVKYPEIRSLTDAMAGSLERQT